MSRVPLALAAVALLAACRSDGAARASRTPARGTPIADAQAVSARAPTAPTDRPARDAGERRRAAWVLRPLEGARPRAKLDLGDGAARYVDDGGARWLARAGEPPTNAPSLLPEPLVSALRAAPPTDGLWIVGRSGAVYPTPTALGDAGPVRAPPGALRSVAVGRLAIVGVSASGALLRTTYGGASWAQVLAPSRARTILDVGLDRAGRGLLLASDGAATSRDDGATWRTIAAPKGLDDVVPATDGRLYARAAAAAASDGGERVTYVLRDDATALEPSTEAPRETFALRRSPDALAYATMLREGRAALVGSRVITVIDDEEGARLGAQTIGGALRTERAPELDGCAQTFVAGARDALLVACDARAPDDDRAAWRPLRLLAREGGGTWREVASLGSGPVPKRLWLAPSGAIVLSGACARRGPACDPGATPLVRAAGATSFAPAAGIAAGQAFTAMAFDGDRAGALAYDAKKRVTALYVSRDGARTFVERPLPSVVARGRTLRVDAPGSLAFEAGRWIAAVRASDAADADDAATRTWLVYATNDDGKTFDVVVTRLARVRGLSLTGRRGYAWDVTGTGWETLDGGATWIPEPAPRAREGSGADAATDAGGALERVACAEGGCVVGDEAMRVGWTDRPPEDSAAAPTPRGSGRL